jgi:hypothetical protein
MGKRPRLNHVRAHRLAGKGALVQTLRWIFPALAAFAALLLLPGVAIAAPGYTDQVKGIEYSATATVGKFSGTATGPLPGAWNATVIHDQLNPAAAVPITGGSVTLYSRRTLTGTFITGTVSPINTPTTCVNERFNVTGKLAFNDGGTTGTFSVVLTHFRAQLRSSCVTYGAAVAGTLTIPSRSAIA